MSPSPLPPRVLFVDNYDSFSASLVDLLQVAGAKVHVVQNDEISLEAAIKHPADALVLGPGPGRPDAAGISLDLLRARAPELPVLGVCLGHQALGLLFGMELGYVATPRHGAAVRVFHGGNGPFQDLPNPFVAAVYNSLTLVPTSLPSDVEIWAQAENGELMSIAAQGGRLLGLQFHPESVLCAEGHALAKAWVQELALERTRRASSAGPGDAFKGPANAL